MQIDTTMIVPSLETEFQGAFDIMLATGTHPRIRSTPINPYTGENCDEWFGNIGNHAVAVGWCAQQLTDLLVDQGAMTREHGAHTIFRALIHDVGKPFEIFRRCIFVDPIQAYYPEATANLLGKLLQHGFPVKVAQTIVSSGIEVGHLALPSYIDGASTRLTLKPGLLESKVVFLSDAICSGPVSDAMGSSLQQISPSEVRISTPRFRARYPWMWQAGLSRDGSGHLEHVWNTSQRTPNLGSFAELQIWATREISRELLSILDGRRYEQPEDVLITRLESIYQRSAAA